MGKCIFFNAKRIIFLNLYIYIKNKKPKCTGNSRANKIQHLAGMITKLYLKKYFYVKLMLLTKRYKWTI